MQASLRLKDPIAPQLVAVLRQAIAEMELYPGQSLSEKDIAARFGVSRQPVREAFIKLSEAGLVEIRPSRGTYVMKISMREVANARLVREAIESDMAKTAANLIQPEQLAVLHELIDLQKQAAEKLDSRSFIKHDEAFHKAIADVIDSDYAWKIVEAARFQTDRVRMLSLPEASPLPRLIRQHEAILHGLETGDGDAASAATRRHLREILIALPRIAAAHPDLFSDSELPEHCRHLVPADE